MGGAATFEGKVRLYAGRAGLRIGLSSGHEVTIPQHLECDPRSADRNAMTFRDQFDVTAASTGGCKSRQIDIHIDL
jgi:hypothetical protein